MKIRNEEISIHDSSTGLISSIIFLLWVSLAIYNFELYLPSIAEKSFYIFFYFLFFVAFYRFIVKLVDVLISPYALVINKKGIFSLVKRNRKYKLEWGNISEIFIKEEVGYSITREEAMSNFPLVPKVIKEKIFEWLRKKDKESNDPSLLEMKDKVLTIKIKDVDLFVRRQHIIRRNHMRLKSFITNKEVGKEINIGFYREKDVASLEKKLPIFIEEYIKT